MICKADEIHNVFDELSGELKTVIAAAEKDIRSIKRVNTTDPQAVFKMLLTLFLCKAIEISQAVIAVLHNDLTLWRVANATARSLLEMYINARYIKKDSETLAKRFCRYDFVRRFHFKKVVSNMSNEIKKLLELDVKRANHLETEYERFKNDYLKKGCSNIHSWHGLSSTELLGAIKEDKENTWLYAFIDSFQCRHIHNESAALEEYLEETEKGFEIRRNVTVEDVDRTLITVIVFFTALYEICGKELAFGKEKWIEEFLRKLTKERGIVIRDEQ